MGKQSAVEELLHRADDAPGAPAKKRVLDKDLEGARVDGKVLVVVPDPKLAELAANVAAADARAKQLAEMVSVVRSELGAKGEHLVTRYNAALGADVQSVRIPFLDGQEEPRGVLVTCSRRYSLKPEILLASRKKLPAFDTLFEVETTKVLRPDAETLLERVLKEAGVPKGKIAKALDTLLETRETVKVRTPAHFDAELAAADPASRQILAQAVTKAAPSLKFEG